MRKCTVVWVIYILLFIVHYLLYTHLQAMVDAWIEWVQSDINTFIYVGAVHSDDLNPRLVVGLRHHIHNVS